MSVLYFHRCLITEFDDFYSTLKAHQEQNVWSLDRVVWFIICSVPLHEINNASFVYDFAAYLLAELSGMPKSSTRTDLFDIVKESRPTHHIICEFQLPETGISMPAKVDSLQDSARVYSARMYTLMEFINKILHIYLPEFVESVYEDITTPATLQALQGYLLDRAKLPSSRTSPATTSVWRALANLQTRGTLSQIVQDVSLTQTKSNFSSSSKPASSEMRDSRFSLRGSADFTPLEPTSTRQSSLAQGDDATLVSFANSATAIRVWKILRLFWSGKTPGGMKQTRQLQTAFVNLPKYHQTVVDPKYTLKGTSHKVTTALVSLDVLNSGWRGFLGIGPAVCNAPQLFMMSDNSTRRALTQQQNLSLIEATGTASSVVVFPKCIERYLQGFKDFKHPRRVFLGHFLARAMSEQAAPTLEHAVQILAKLSAVDGVQFNALSTKRLNDLENQFKYFRKENKKEMPMISCKSHIFQSLDENLVNQFVPECPFTDSYRMTSDIEDLGKVASDIQTSCCADLAHRNRQPSPVGISAKTFENSLQDPFSKWAAFARKK